MPLSATVLSNLCLVSQASPQERRRERKVKRKLRRGQLPLSNRQPLASSRGHSSTLVSSAMAAALPFTALVSSASFAQTTISAQLARTRVSMWTTIWSPFTSPTPTTRGDSTMVRGMAALGGGGGGEGIIVAVAGGQGMAMGGAMAMGGGHGCTLISGGTCMAPHQDAVGASLQGSHRRALRRWRRSSLQLGQHSRRLKSRPSWSRSSGRATCRTLEKLCPASFDPLE